MELARIERIASRFTLRDGSILEREDLVQEGALADLRGRMVRWGILDLIRRTEGGVERGKARYRRMRTLDERVTSMCRSETENLELREAIHAAIETLPEPGRKIFEGRFAGLTLKAIGKSCHRTESWACRELMLATPGFRLFLERALGWD